MRCLRRVDSLAESKMTLIKKIGLIKGPQMFLIRKVLFPDCLMIELWHPILRVLRNTVRVLYNLPIRHLKSIPIDPLSILSHCFPIHVWIHLSWGIRRSSRMIKSPALECTSSQPRVPCHLSTIYKRPHVTKEGNNLAYWLNYLILQMIHCYCFVPCKIDLSED